MKAFYLFAVALLFFAACGSDSDTQKTLNQDEMTAGTDSSDLNTFISKTLFDSLPVEKLPYTDSISLESFKPLRSLPLGPKQLSLLQVKELRVFKQYERPLNDSLFTAVCRLKLSPAFYTVIINYNGQNETMNYILNYDKDFKLIDYMECSYDELVESALRTRSVIDTQGMTVYFSDIMPEPDFKSNFHYELSPEGFFRERLASK